jgi:hypothetical protein
MWDKNNSILESVREQYGSFIRMLTRLKINREGVPVMTLMMDNNLKTRRKNGQVERVES